MVEDKCIKDLVADYINSIGSAGSYHAAWKEASGELSSMTELSRIDRGIIYVKAKGSPASNLLMLKKRKILKAINTLIPDLNAKDIKVERFF